MQRSLDARKDDPTPISPSIQQMHRLLALRARLRGVQGTFALTIQGRGFDSKVSPARTIVHGLRMRLLRRLRAGLPDRDAVENP
jgi:hypothetical protein